MVTVPLAPPTVLDDPNVMFTQDLIADEPVIPALEDPHRVPRLKIYARGTTSGTPDIVTARTEAYIVGWSERDPDE